MGEILPKVKNKEFVYPNNESVISQLLSQFTNYQIELELQNHSLLQAQIELSKERDKYQELYNSAPITYLTLDENGIILEINEAGCTLFGIKKIFLINKSFTRYIDPNYQSIFSQHCQNVLKSMDSHSCELKLIRRKGSLFYAKVVSKKIIDSNSDKKHILIFIYDISDQKKTQESLHQQQVRIAQIDRANSANALASILAHEINNPIGVIINYINGCIYRLKNNTYKVEDLISVLNKTADQVKHISEITLRLKNFSCKEHLQLEHCCINKLISEVIDFLYYEVIDFPVKIIYRELKYFKPMLLDKIHIQQVIINLARNAIEAMQEAKTIEPKIIIEANQINPAMIEISVNDNGPGINEHNHKLFDLHYTTKPYGTGLGLAVSRAIVEAHQGELYYENNPFNGASFKFTLKC